MDTLYVQILYSIVVATVYGLARYFQQHTQERFDPKLFAKTLIIGAVVGAAQHYFGWTYDQAFQWVIGNATLMVLIDQIVDRLFKLHGTLKKLIDTALARWNLITYTVAEKQAAITNLQAIQAWYDQQGIPPSERNKFATLGDLKIYVNTHVDVLDAMMKETPIGKYFIDSLKVRHF